MIKLSHPAATTSTTSTTTRPEDQGTRGQEDRGTRGPEDREDQRTGGPGDQEDQEDQRTKKKKKCPPKKEKNSQNKSAPLVSGRVSAGITQYHSHFPEILSMGSGVSLHRGLWMISKVMGLHAATAWFGMPKR